MYTAVLIVGISQMTFSNSNELIMLDDFDPSPKVEWNFVADSVMVAFLLVRSFSAAMVAKHLQV